MAIHLDHLNVPAKVQAAGIAYRSQPHGPDDHQIKPEFGGRLI